MSYHQLVESDHYGNEPRAIDPMGACCSSCERGGPCGTGITGPDNPVKFAIALAGLAVGYILLKKAAAD